MLENIWSEGNRLEDRNLEQQSSILNISGLPRLTVVINSVWSGSRSSRTVSKSGSAFLATIRRFYFLRFLIGNSRVILKRGKISKNSLILFETWYSPASLDCNFVTNFLLTEIPIQVSAYNICYKLSIRSLWNMYDHVTREISVCKTNECSMIRRSVNYWLFFCVVDKIDAKIEIHLISIKILDTYLGMVVCRISRWALKSSLWIWWGWGCVGRG